MLAIAAKLKASGDGAYTAAEGSMFHNGIRPIRGKKEYLIYKHLDWFADGGI